MRIPRPATREEEPWRVIEPFWDPLSEAEVAESDFRYRLAELSPGQRAIFATSWLNSEVTNGGFRQFFMNHLPVLFAEARKGFQLFNACKYTALLDRVQEALPDGLPGDWGARQKVFESLDIEAFRLFDDRYYALCDTISLEDLCRVYIDEHSDEFFLPA